MGRCMTGAKKFEASNCNFRQTRRSGSGRGRGQGEEGGGGRGRVCRSGNICAAPSRLDVARMRFITRRVQRERNDDSDTITFLR
jgi:hypothetical protein